MWHFKPADDTRAWALRREIEAQQESLGYSSPSRRHLKKLYVALDILLAIALPAPDTRSEITSFISHPICGRSGP